MGKLLLARFLVVSELRGDGGHVLEDGERPSVAVCLSRYTDSADEPEGTLCLCNPTLTSLPVNAQNTMGIKHFDSERHPPQNRPPTHTVQII